jgi:hypothetical protein
MSIKYNGGYIPAVGNNGETLVADSSTSTGLRYTAGNPIPNPTLNSAMQCWQRGTSFTVGAASPYTADRWQANRGGLATGLTVSRQVTGDTTNLPFIQYAARVQRDSGNTSTATTNLWQNFESINSIPFAGKTVTFSFYARAGANYSSTSNLLNINLYSGTGTDQNVNVAGFTGATQVITTNSTLTTTWQRFTYTGTVASTATQLAMLFVCTPTGTAGANDYFEFTGVQLDIGSVALPFRTYAGTIQGELAACQRYYQRYNFPTATGGGVGTGVAVNTTIFDTNFTPAVAFRVAPTALDTSTPSVYYPPIGGQYNSGTFTIASFSTSNSVDIRYTHGSGVFTAGMGGVLTSSVNNGYIGLTAEL